MTDNATSVPPLKRELLTETIPASACTPALLKMLQDYAKAEKISVAAVVRHAVALFLNGGYDEAVEITENSSNEEAHLD